jgi:hypothetical protein
LCEGRSKNVVKNRSAGHVTRNLQRLYALAANISIMALQEYVRSIGRAHTVSKEQVFRFLEMQFARADRDHDGLLDIEELDLFVQSIARLEADQR